MSDGPTPDHDAGRYEICVGGHLASRWGAWFDGMTLTRNNDGTTVISGAVPDQAALHGLLRTLSDLGVPLVSVRRTTPEATGPGHHKDSAGPPTRADLPHPHQPKEQT